MTPVFLKFTQEFESIWNQGAFTKSLLTSSRFSQLLTFVSEIKDQKTTERREMVSRIGDEQLSSFRPRLNTNTGFHS